MIEFAYGGEPAIVDNLVEQAEAGNAIELLANNKDLCVFTAEELARHGFDPDELVAAQQIESQTTGAPLSARRFSHLRGEG